jgi:hypothetical protein
MAYELKDNSGSAFEQERKSDNHPHLEGDFKIICPHCSAESRGWLKLWRRQGKTGEWLSAAFKFREKQPQRETPQGERKVVKSPERRVIGRDDDMPF